MWASFSVHIDSIYYLRREDTVFTKDRIVFSGGSIFFGDGFGGGGVLILEFCSVVVTMISQSIMWGTKANDISINMTFLYEVCH